MTTSLSPASVSSISTRANSDSIFCFRIFFKFRILDSDHFTFSEGRTSSKYQVLLVKISSFSLNPTQGAKLAPFQRTRSPYRDGKGRVETVLQHTKQKTDQLISLSLLNLSLLFFGIYFFSCTSCFSFYIHVVACQNHDI